jgi:hypothetical protein
MWNVIKDNTSVFTEETIRKNTKEIVICVRIFYGELRLSQHTVCLPNGISNIVELETIKSSPISY